VTIEELLNCDVTLLEAMTDDELLEHFKPYLIVCQPPLDDSVKVVKGPKRKRKTSISVREKRTLEEQMRELADLHDVDLDEGADLLPANLK
jgi:RNA recognition motif-containing protein